MTDQLRAAAEAALEALVEADPLGRAGTIEKLRAALAEPVQEPPSAIDIEEHIDGLAECWRLIGAKEAMRGMNMYGPQDAISERGLRNSEIEHRRAIRAVLAEPEKKYRFEWRDFCALLQIPSDPPRREWQGLTDDEIDRVTDSQWAANNNKPIYAAHRAYARAIEAALKGKNGA